MEENNINLIEQKEESVIKDADVITKEEKKEIEKQKSRFRVFWLILAINIILFGYILYLIIDIFIKAFNK